MCRGRKIGEGRVDSSVDFKGLRLEAGNLRRPSQLSRPEMVAVAIWSRPEENTREGLIPEISRRSS